MFATLNLGSTSSSSLQPITGILSAEKVTNKKISDFSAINPDEYVLNGLELVSKSSDNHINQSNNTDTVNIARNQQLYNNSNNINQDFSAYNLETGLGLGSSDLQTQGAAMMFGQSVSRNHHLNSTGLTGAGINQTVSTGAPTTTVTTTKSQTPGFPLQSNFQSGSSSAFFNINNPIQSGPGPGSNNHNAAVTSQVNNTAPMTMGPGFGVASNGQGGGTNVNLDSPPRNNFQYQNSNGIGPTFSNIGTGPQQTSSTRNKPNQTDVQGMTLVSPRLPNFESLSNDLRSPTFKNLSQNFGLKFRSLNGSNQGQKEESINHNNTTNFKTVTNLSQTIFSHQSESNFGSGQVSTGPSALSQQNQYSKSISSTLEDLRLELDACRQYIRHEIQPKLTQLNLAKEPRSNSSQTNLKKAASDAFNKTFTASGFGVDDADLIETQQQSQTSGLTLFYELDSFLRLFDPSPRVNNNAPAGTGSGNNFGMNSISNRKIGSQSNNYSQNQNNQNLRERWKTLTQGLQNRKDTIMRKELAESMGFLQDTTELADCPSVFEFLVEEAAQNSSSSRSSPNNIQAQQVSLGKFTGTTTKGLISNLQGTDQDSNQAPSNAFATLSIDQNQKKNQTQYVTEDIDANDVGPQNGQNLNPESGSNNLSSDDTKTTAVPILPNNYRKSTQESGPVTNIDVSTNAKAKGNVITTISQTGSVVTNDASSQSQSGPGAAASNSNSDTVKVFESSMSTISTDSSSSTKAKNSIHEQDEPIRTPPVPSPETEPSREPPFSAPESTETSSATQQTQSQSSNNQQSSSVTNIQKQPSQDSQDSEANTNQTAQVTKNDSTGGKGLVPKPQYILDMQGQVYSSATEEYTEHHSNFVIELPGSGKISGMSTFARIALERIKNRMKKEDINSFSLIGEKEQLFRQGKLVSEDLDKHFDCDNANNRVYMHEIRKARDFLKLQRKCKAQKDGPTTKSIRSTRDDDSQSVSIKSGGPGGGSMPGSAVDLKKRRGPTKGHPLASQLYLSQAKYRPAYAPPQPNDDDLDYLERTYAQKSPRNRSPRSSRQYGSNSSENDKNPNASFGANNKKPYILYGISQVLNLTDKLNHPSQLDPAEANRIKNSQSQSHQAQISQSQNLHLGHSISPTGNHAEQRPGLNPLKLTAPSLNSNPTCSPRLLGSIGPSAFSPVQRTAATTSVLVPGLVGPGTGPSGSGSSPKNAQNQGSSSTQFNTQQQQNKVELGGPGTGFPITFGQTRQNTQATAGTSTDINNSLYASSNDGQENSGALRDFSENATVEQPNRDEQYIYDESGSKFRVISTKPMMDQNLSQQQNHGSIPVVGAGQFDFRPTSTFTVTPNVHNVSQGARNNTTNINSQGVRTASGGNLSQHPNHRTGVSGNVTNVNTSGPGGSASAPNSGNLQTATAINPTASTIQQNMQGSPSDITGQQQNQNLSQNSSGTLSRHIGLPPGMQVGLQMSFQEFLQKNTQNQNQNTNSLSLAVSDSSAANSTVNTDTTNTNNNRFDSYQSNNKTDEQTPLFGKPSITISPNAIKKPSRSTGGPTGTVTGPPSFKSSNNQGSIELSQTIQGSAPPGTAYTSANGLILPGGDHVSNAPQSQNAVGPMKLDLRQDDASSNVICVNEGIISNE